MSRPQPTPRSLLTALGASGAAVGIGAGGIVRDLGAGYHRIANRATGLVLDGGGQVASGSMVKQWNWDGSTNLLWTIAAV